MPKIVNFSQEARAKLPDAVWAYGGPASAEQFVGVLVDRMTGA